MLKQLLEALQNQFPGVDARILNRIATKLAKTVTDEAGVADAVKAVTFQQVLVIGNFAYPIFGKGEYPVFRKVQILLCQKCRFKVNDYRSGTGGVCRPSRRGVD